MLIPVSPLLVVPTLNVAYPMSKRYAPACPCLWELHLPAVQNVPSPRSVLWIGRVLIRSAWILAQRILAETMPYAGFATTAPFAAALAATQAMPSLVASPFHVSLILVTLGLKIVNHTVPQRRLLRPRTNL